MPDGSEAIAAGLTLYRPDRRLFDPLLARLREDTAHVFVFVDGPNGEAIEPAHLAELEAVAGITVLSREANSGIARGLNRLAAAARADGYRHLALFDQDSHAPAGLPVRLAAALARLHAAGHRPAGVGARPVPATGSDTRAPRYRPRGPRLETLAAVEFVIISGMLLDLRVLPAVGPFDETLRMDGVDLEWGFRAAARGHAVWVDEGVQLSHRVGEGTLRLGPLAFPRQSEARMENYVASQARLLRMPHVPLRWKLRSLLYVPVQIAASAARGGRPSAHLRRLGAAAIAGLRAAPTKDELR